jgi:hypothetical protein
MLRVRGFLLASMGALLAACSETTSPTKTTSPTDPAGSEPAFRPQGGGVQAQAEELSVRQGADARTLLGGVVPSHAIRCNSGFWECMRINHNGPNFVTFVAHAGEARGFGRSRSRISVNGVLVAVSGRVAHGPGDVLSIRWVFRRNFRLGTRFCVDWFGAGAASPPGFVCQRL